MNEKSDVTDVDPIIKAYESPRDRWLAIRSTLSKAVQTWQSVTNMAELCDEFIVGVTNTMFMKHWPNFGPSFPSRSTLEEIPGPVNDFTARYICVLLSDRIYLFRRDVRPRSDVIHSYAICGAIFLSTHSERLEIHGSSDHFSLGGAFNISIHPRHIDGPSQTLEFTPVSRDSPSIGAIWKAKLCGKFVSMNSYPYFHWIFSPVTFTVCS